MYEIDFSNKIHIHFIGIGGISMSGLAELLYDKGFSISGSDTKESDLTKSLEKQGIKIFYGQHASNIQDTYQLIVYTAAIHKDNEELAEALRRKIPALTRAELLGQVMKNYKTSIAVSGTHGKTTTTSMISEILLSTDSDPTLSIGGILKTIDGNFRIGGSDLFVTEACEYTNSFLSFYPKIALILNVEEDHLDFFKDIHEIRQSFHEFASHIPSDGTLIINGDIEGLDIITKDLNCSIITYGTSTANNYSAKNISFDTLARPTFTLYKDGNESGVYSLGVTGEHNIMNALAAIAAAELLQVDLKLIKKSLLTFSGTERRFEYKGEVNGFTIIDDYAHHPTEISATLNAAKNYPHKTTWCVFQPHTYTRTKAFMKEFAKALSIADKVVLADIYAARETDHLGISSETLKNEVEQLGTEVYYINSFEEIEKFLLKNCLHGDLLITMGAGDIVKVGENLIKK